jgi:hypothetical protein
MMHYQQMTPQPLLSPAWVEKPRSQRLSLVHPAFIVKRKATTASMGVLIGISITSGKHFTMSLASCSLPEHASWPLSDSNLTAFLPKSNLVSMKLVQSYHNDRICAMKLLRAHGNRTCVAERAFSDECIALLMRVSAHTSALG